MASGRKPGSVAMFRLRTVLLPLALHLVVASVEAFEPKDPYAVMYAVEEFGDPNKRPVSKFDLQGFVHPRNFDKWYNAYENEKASTADRLAVGRSLFEQASQEHESWRKKMQEVQDMAEKVIAQANPLSPLNAKGRNTPLLLKHLVQLRQSCSPETGVEILKPPTHPGTVSYDVKIRNPLTYFLLWHSRAKSLEIMRKRVVALYAYVISRNGKRRSYEPNEKFINDIWSDRGYRNLFWTCTDFVLGKGDTEEDSWKKDYDPDLIPDEAGKKPVRDPLTGSTNSRPGHSEIEFLIQEGRNLGTIFL